MEGFESGEPRGDSNLCPLEAIHQSFDISALHKKEAGELILTDAQGSILLLEHLTCHQRFRAK